MDDYDTHSKIQELTKKIGAVRKKLNVEKDYTKRQILTYEIRILEIRIKILRLK